ncbi:MAG: hypothetical protein ABI477_04230 [Chryseolinea sp.]
MKKLAYSLVCALILVSMSRSDVFAQEIQKGNFILSPGIGFGYQFWGGITVGVNGEYAFSDQISGGGYLAFTNWGGYAYQSNVTFFDVGVRASYHFAKLLRVPNKKFDPYAGAQVGGAFSNYDNEYTVGGVKYRYNGSYGRGVRGGLYAGARWYFNDRFGVYGEVGFALCPIMGGVTFKF